MTTSTKSTPLSNATIDMLEMHLGAVAQAALSGNRSGLIAAFDDLQSFISYAAGHDKLSSKRIQIMNAGNEAIDRMCNIDPEPQPPTPITDLPLFAYAQQQTTPVALLPATAGQGA